VTEGNAAAVPDSDGGSGAVSGAVGGAVGDAVDAVVSIYY
jgi:hypothetical protein